MRLRATFTAAAIGLLLAAMAGCGGGLVRVEEPQDDAATPGLETPQTASEAKERAKRRRPPSLSEARARAEERLRELESRRKSGADVAAKKTLTGNAVAERYEALLALPGTPAERKPEILLRLAELAYREEEGALKHAFETGTDMDILPGDRYPMTIGYYRRLADGYPESSQALIAFYNLGYLYGEEGERELSVRAYREVLKRDTATPYASEIHMRLGEAAFDSGFYRESIRHYEAVVAAGRREYVDKALYKLGWSHYKLDDYATAVEVFSRIVDQGETTAENLREETIDIMGRAFVEWGGVDGVSRYLEGREAGRAYGDKLYKKLGDLYLESSRHLDAVASLTRGVDAFPLSALALAMEEGIITADLALRDTEGANARRQTWYDRYRPGTPWDRAHGAKLGTTRDGLLEKGLRLAALYRHSRAQRGEGSLDVALEQYARYAELYGMGTEDGYEMAYSQAQALREAGRNREAAARYGMVAESTAHLTHREDASYRRIESLDALRRADPSAFDEFVAAHQRYAQLNPGSELVPKLLFAMGELTFEAERFEESRAAFRRVADEFPGHELAPRAAERIARCYFREERYAEAEEAARQTLRRRPDDETRDQALKLISFGIFKQAESADAGGKLDDAVKHYFRLAKEFPDGEAAQVSLYRAAEDLRKLGKEERAAAVYQQLAESYRDSRYAESALTLSSEILSSLGDWRGVAKNYEDLYRMAPEGPDAATNLFRAALGREKAEMVPEALALMGEFLAAFPGEPRTAQILYRRATLEEKGGEADRALLTYASVWETPAEGEESLYRAKAALALGEKELAVFRSVELKGDLEAALTLKEGHLDKALGYLANAAGMPFVEPISASLYYAGEAYEQMKTAILESERPAEFSAEELEQYEFLLEEKAFPLEEQAIAFYRKGIEAARRAGGANPWADKMYARLETLMPWAFQRSEQSVEVWLPPPYEGKGWEVTR